MAEDGYFRILTTVFGICVIDVWRGYQAMCKPNHRHYDIPMKPFVDVLILDLLENNEKEFEKETEKDYVLPLDQEHPSVVDAFTNESQDTEVSGLTHHSSQTSAHSLSACGFSELCHVLQLTTEKVAEKGKSGGRRKQNRCSECGKKTSFFCASPECTRVRTTSNPIQGSVRDRQTYWLCTMCVSSHRQKKVKVEMVNEG